MPIDLFKLDRILVSTEDFFALHRGIAEASSDPAIGLKLGTEERVERYRRMLDVQVRQLWRYCRGEATDYHPFTTR